MFKDYLKTFLLTTLQILFVIGGLVLVFTKGEGLRILSNLPFLSIAILLILFLVSYLTHRRVDHLGAMQKQLKETLHLKEEADKEAKTWKAGFNRI